MEAKENESIIKAVADETTAIKMGSRSQPGLKALLAIKNFTATLEKNYIELLQIESGLDKLNVKALLLIEGNTSPEATTQWKESLQEVNASLIAINKILTEVKDNIQQKAKEGYLELWEELALHLSALRKTTNNTASLGLNLLPEVIHSQWKEEFIKIETLIVEDIFTHVESCRILLQIIERYTTDELNSITQIIVDKIPLDFTYDDAVEYQNDYYKALTNFKKEFKEEKNLWDKFLDILAGGTHQLPSERVMMERWLDGEKEGL